MHRKQKNYEVSHILWYCILYDNINREEKKFLILLWWNVKLFVIRQQDYPSINPTWPDIQASINSDRSLNERARECLKLNAGSTLRLTNCTIKYEGEAMRVELLIIYGGASHARTVRMRESPFTNRSLLSFYRAIIKNAVTLNGKGARERENSRRTKKRLSPPPQEVCRDAWVNAK